MSRWKRTLATVSWNAIQTFAWVSVLVFFLWSAGAINHMMFLPRLLAKLLALVYFFTGMVFLVRSKRKNHWRAYAAASIIVVYLLTLIHRPVNDRDWDPTQIETTSVEIKDGHVSIGGFRHCVYRSESDFDVHYRSYDFELESLNKVWFFVQKFSALEGLAHTFLSFQVDTGNGPEYFSVSVEIRREAGEEYSPITGLYRRFELMYVVGDERDLVGVRTIIRPSDRVYMYEVNATPEQTQQLFVNIANRIEQLRSEPEFYHTLLSNCTNGIVFRTYDLTPEPINWLDPRIVLPGYSDRFAHSQGLIGGADTVFSELQQACRIDGRAKEIGLSQDFSRLLRTQAHTK